MSRYYWLPFARTTPHHIQQSLLHFYLILRINFLFKKKSFISGFVFTEAQMTIQNNRNTITRGYTESLNAKTNQVMSSRRSVR